MDDGLYRLSDEVLGARDAGSRLAGDLEFTEAELVQVRARYLARFLPRLAGVAREALESGFPGRVVREVHRPASSRSQAELFHGAACAAPSPGEVDFILA